MKHLRVLAVLGAAITAAMFMFCGDNVVQVPGDGGTTPGTTPGDGNIPPGPFYTITKSAKGYEVTSAGLKKAAAPNEKINDALTQIAVDAGDKPAISIQFGKVGSVLNIGDEQAKLGVEWVGPKAIVLAGTLQGGGATNIPLDISEADAAVVISFSTSFKALNTGGSPARVRTKDGDKSAEDLEPQGGTSGGQDNSTRAACDVVNSPDGNVIGECAQPVLKSAASAAAKPRFSYVDTSAKNVIDSLGRYAKVNVLRIEVTLGSAGSPLDIGPRIIDIDTLNWKYPVTILGSVEGTGTSVINITKNIPQNTVELKNIDVTNTSATGNAVTTATPIKVVAADLEAKGGSALEIASTVSGTVAITGGSLTVTTGTALKNNSTSATVTTRPLIDDNGVEHNLEINVGTGGTPIGGTGSDNVETDAVVAPNAPLAISGGAVSFEVSGWGTTVTISRVSLLGATLSNTKFFTLITSKAATAPSIQTVLANNAEVTDTVVAGSSFTLRLPLEDYFGGDTVRYSLVATSGGDEVILHLLPPAPTRASQTIRFASEIRTSGESGELKLFSTLKGSAYYAVTAKNAAAPTWTLPTTHNGAVTGWTAVAGDVGPTLTAADAGRVIPITIGSSLSTADVDVHFYVVSGFSVYSSLFTNSPASKVTLPTLAATAPPYVSNLEAIRNKNRTSATISFTSSRAGAGYYKIGSTASDAGVFEIDPADGSQIASNSGWNAVYNIAAGANSGVTVNGLTGDDDGKYVHFLVVSENTSGSPKFVRSAEIRSVRVPAFVVVTPVIDSVGWLLTDASEATLKFSTDQAVGRTWYTVGSAALAPGYDYSGLTDKTTTQTIDGDSWVLKTVTTANGNFEIEGVDISSGRFVTVVAEHATGGLSLPRHIDLSDVSYTPPPGWTDAPALTARVGKDSLVISFTADAPGTVFYALAEPNATAPDVSAFVKLQIPGSSPDGVVTDGSAANTDVVVKIPTGSTQSAGKDLYIIVKTDATNSSDPDDLVHSEIVAGKIEVGAVPTYPDLSAEYDDATATEKLTITVDITNNTEGGIYYVVKDGMNTTTPANVGALLDAHGSTAALAIAASSADLIGEREAGDVVWIVIKTKDDDGADYYSEIIALEEGAGKDFVVGP